MRLLGEDLAVLERARLGLVGVADRVVRLRAPGRRRSPTSGRSGSRRRPCRAARSPSASRRSPRGAGRRRARGGTRRSARRRARTGRSGGARPRGAAPRVSPRSPPRAAATAASASAIAQRPLVDGRGRRDVAAAEAGDLDDLDLDVVAVALLRLADALVGAVQPAREVVADRELRRPSAATCGSAGRTRSRPRSRTAGGARRATARRAPRAAASRTRCWIALSAGIRLGPGNLPARASVPGIARLDAAGRARGRCRRRRS